MEVCIYSLRDKSLQSCPSVCHPMDCSPPGPTVHGILQARILERVAMPSSRGSSPPRDQTLVFYVSCIGRWVLYHYCHLGSLFYRLDFVNAKTQAGELLRLLKAEEGEEQRHSQVCLAPKPTPPHHCDSLSRGSSFLPLPPFLEVQKWVSMGFRSNKSIVSRKRH